MKQINEFISLVKSLYPGNQPVNLHEPVFIGNERKYVLNAIDSTFVSSVGEYVNKFEEMVAKISGSKYAVATVNGTAALHTALIVSGVKKNEIVISQALTFVATCNAINYIGASNVFVDVDFDTLGMSPDSLLTWLENNTIFRIDPNSGLRSSYCKRTNQRIAAIVPMHTFGHSCRIDKIVDIAKYYNIPLIEDAAESIGSSFNGKHTGVFGNLGVFSFNGNKTVTAGGGGVIVTDDEKLAKLSKHLTTQAKVPHKWEFFHDRIGYNYRMPNINAALACAQLEQLNFFLRNKRELADIYIGFFKDKDNIEFIAEPEGNVSNYWLCSIRLGNKRERDQFLKVTNENSIMTRPSWTLMTELPMFKNSIHDGLPNSYQIADTLVNLPSGVRLKDFTKKV